MTRADKRIGFEIALLGLLALLWGSSYLFIKIAVETIPPITLIAARVSIAAIMLTCVMYLCGERLPRDTATWRMLFIQACFSSIFSWTLLAWGQQFIGSGLASVLNSTSPIFVFFITLLLTRHESVHALRLMGAILGLVGVILIVGVDALQGLGDQVAGQLAAVTSAFLYGCAAIYGSRFKHISSTVTASGTMIVAALVLVPLSLVVDQPWTLKPSSDSILAVLALGILCTGTAMFIYFRLIRTLGSMGVASQAYLRAGVGVALGLVVLGEHITPVVGLGLAAAIAGVVAINYSTIRASKSP